MMKKKILKNSKYRLIILAGLLLFTSALLARFTYSKFVSTKTSSVDARVAFFLGDSGSWQKLNKEILPGDTLTYAIDVSNTKGNKMTETAVQYTLHLETFASLPLTYQLQEKNASGNWQTIDFSKNQYTAKLVSGAEVAKTQEYLLTVTWPEAEKDYSYSSQLKILRLGISTEQID